MANLASPSTANGLVSPVVPAPTPWPRTRERLLSIDAETVVRSVLARAREIGGDANRGQWLEQRAARYAKYRGWLPPKSFPWPDASNVHLGLMQTAELRANAGLHNVVMSLRPLLSAKATRPVDLPREERITALLDAQLFLDPGPERAERVFSDFCSMFLQDGNAVLYTPWIRDERAVRMVHYRRPVPAGIDPERYLQLQLAPLLPGLSDLRRTSASRYQAQRTGDGDEPTEVMIEVTTDEDGALQIAVTQDQTLFDGPVALPVPIESIYVRTRVENLQPPSGWNPNGAPEVVLLVHYRIDEIRRRKASGEFNWLDEEGLRKIVAAARAGAGVAAGQIPEALEAQKDTMEGREHREPPVLTDEEVAQLSVPCYLCFDRWDVDGDGFAEDTIWTIARDAEVLCEARRLTDVYPAVRPQRPLAESIALPVPGRWYGISLLELGEALNDLIKTIFDQSLDNATISNLPFFFYSLSSKLAPENFRIGPGEGIGVPGPPREAVWFPELSTATQQWAFSFIGVAMQFYERLMQLGDLQFGRVPTGKASALRTMGTTVALLQQGDVRADQLLVRLFSGLRQVARNFHAMNRHLLPDGKEIRVLGWAGEREQGYLRISRAEVDRDIDFEFRPDFLLSNRAVLAQTMQTVLTVLATPLAFQLGITDPEKFYRAVQDYLRALNLDPKLYIASPSKDAGPPLLAEEALDLILQNQLPEGPPLEGDEIHLKKLQAFARADDFGHLTAAQVSLFRAYLQSVAARRIRGQAAQAAQGFQQMLQQQQGGGGGVPTTMETPGVTEGLPSPSGAGLNA